MFIYDDFSPLPSPVPPADPQVSVDTTMKILHESPDQMRRLQDHTRKNLLQKDYFSPLPPSTQDPFNFNDIIEQDFYSTNFIPEVLADLPLNSPLVPLDDMGCVPPSDYFDLNFDNFDQRQVSAPASKAPPQRTAMSQLNSIDIIPPQHYLIDALNPTVTPVPILPATPTITQYTQQRHDRSFRVGVNTNMYSPFLGQHQHSLPLTNPLPSNRSYIQDDRRFVCNYQFCRRRFKRMEHLRRHHRIHTGEKPYVCPVPKCGKTFARTDNLSQHLKVHPSSEYGSARTEAFGFMVRGKEEEGMKGDQQLQIAIAPKPI